MTKEKVIWTALPNGLDDEKRLRISVHVAPRLSNADGSGTIRQLGEFPAFENWPQRLESIHFQIDFDGTISAPAILESAPDPALWKLLFPPEMPVRPFAFQDHSMRNLHVFPVRPLLQFLEQAYGQVAAGGAQVPAIDDPAGPLALFFPLRYITTWITDSSSFYEELDRARQSEKGDGRVVREAVADPSLPYSLQAAQNSFFQAYRFYTRPGSQRPDFPVDYVEPPPEAPEFDFHQMVAQLGDHLELLRRLGLVVDLVVDLPEPHGHLAAQGIVRVAPEGELPEDPPTCPGTRYGLEDLWFGARPQNSFRMSRGLLRLSPEVYDLFQVDVDGAALQIAGFAGTLGDLLDPQRRGPHSPDEATVPALRSAGLTLARLDRGDLLLEDLKDRRSKNDLVESDPTGLAVVFDAEDLVRGYRVDVFDEDASGGERWFSLHRRVSQYELKDSSGELFEDPLVITGEGYVKATSAASERADHPNASDDLYLHETVFGWEGWSLSAPRPGKRIVEPGEGEGGGEIARYDPEVGNSFPLVTRVSPEPRSLPRLRIGHTYRLRARTVDLAGNSRPFSEADYEPQEPDLVSQKQTYLRFEPVPSPAILRRHLDTEGESLEHLVIRSNLAVSAADYAASPEVVAALEESGAPHTYAGDAQRHLAPPKTSQLMAEQDGRFEAAFGGSPAQMTAALRMALREEGTFLEETIVNTNTGQKTLPQATIATFPAGTPLPPRGEPLPEGAYPYYPDEAVSLPYLPDPLAVGLALTGYDFTGSEVFHEIAVFPGDWPHLEPFCLRLSEGALGAAFSGGVLEVTLPKAEVIQARLSSVFPDGRLEDLAIWHWVPPAARTAAFKQHALEGRHWMLTPFRLVTFTHAVQQPLQIPAMTAVTSTRHLGSTYVEFRGAIHCHAKSTGRLDVFGEWSEDIDLLSDPEPRMRAFGTQVSHQAFAFGFDIHPGEDQAQVYKASPVERISRHEFSDTKYRRILYHSVATTRFRELLPPPIANDPARIQRVEAATQPDGAPIPALVHDILSSARPAAPEVLYVLPTFRWERQDEGDVRQHVRHGKSLRVWLSRPWFSSGDGEQLAVVLAPGVKLPKGWERLAPQLEMAAHELAIKPPLISLSSLEREPQAGEAAGPGAGPAAAFSSASPLELSKLTSTSVMEKIAGVFAAASPPSPAEVKRMLQPYASNWGSDPVWASALPETPPTVAAFPRHAGYAAGLTLEELPGSVKVVVAAHEVYYDRARQLWYCDIEIDPGQTYYPFIRLGLARYQPHSLPNAHLSRVVMTDFIQVVPDRTAQVALAGDTATVTVKGFAGRNIVGNLAAPLLPLGDVPGSQDKSPNTTMRVALERRLPGIPGDLGWERVGKDLPLTASASGYFVTWTGTLALPEEALAGGSHRLVITEVETYLRDLLPGDPGFSTSPVDFVRERVVYADIFEL